MTMRRIERVCAALLLALASSVALAAQQAPDRSKAPAPGPAPVLKPPAIVKQTLSNGLPVWIVEMHEVPVVDLTLIVKSGSAADPAGKYGLASFTAAMLDEGAGTRSALELADAIDFLGASLSTSNTYDASTVHLHALASKFNEALPLLADVSLRPTFPTTEMERIRKERLTSLLQTLDNPSSLASVAFSRQVFGNTHRYGTPMIGNDATNTAMTVADLKSFYSAHYQPTNAHLLVVGDVTSATVVPALEKAFGSWKGAGAVTQPALPTATRPAARQIYLVDKPGAAQSQIRIGSVGVARSTADYYVIDVMNTILGGSFSSRLNQNLREEHGYTYGASSYFDMRRSAGPFLAAAGVQTDKTVESLQEFFKELDGMRTPVPANELARGKSLEALSYPSAFETTEQMADRLAELVVYGLPESTLGDYVPKIQAVGAADVQRAATQYLPADRFVVVVVGDLSKIEQLIRSANLGPVSVLSVQDVTK